MTQSEDSPPDGKVRVIDKADVEYVTLTEEGLEVEYVVQDSHLEDESEFNSGGSQ